MTIYYMSYFLVLRQKTVKFLLIYNNL